ncbi:MAG TPA: adenylate/guanylate cyclase domain-containing protein [Rhodocyclaceae bacterium]|nr:adenylate/guanylate cyclase domain-containing protein [Rhodocyclaceae bacterium]
MAQATTSRQDASPKRSPAAWVLLIALAAVLVAELLTRAGALAGFERFYGDLWCRVAGQRATPQKVVLIKLDEATLSAYPDEPLVFWGPRFAQACSVLRQAGVAVIGLDMLFSASPEQWLAKLGALGASGARNFDQAFRQELATGKVVVAGMQSAQETLLPAADYLVALPDFDAARFVGAADLAPDPDGTLRRFRAVPPVDRAEGDLRLLSLPFLLAVHASSQSPAAESWHFGGRAIGAGDAVTLAYAGPPGTVPSLSLRDLLQENALRDPRVQALHGKVAIIGASYGGMNDAHMTPYGRGFFDAPLMLGAEIQAQTVDALLAGRFVDDWPAGWRLALTLAIVLPAAWFWSRQRLWLGVPFLGLPLVLAAAAGYLAFRSDLLLPAAHIQLTAILACTGIYGWRFTHGEREREHLRGVFSRYIEPQLVEALLASPTLPQLGGEAVQVTVLFTDIRNFTTISEKMAPEEVVEMLNAYFERACAVLAAEGGCIDKFIGDAIMVEFGVPLRSDDHARRALRAAIRLKEVAAEFRQWMHQRYADRDLPEFAVGIGVHTGPAVVGNIGTTARMEYTAIGDSVNLASRLEGMTKTMGCVILASRETLEAAGPGIELGRSGTVTVKGRHQPVDVWEILGVGEEEKNA